MDSFLHINITKMADMLFDAFHNLLFILRLSVRFGYPKDNRRYQLYREKRRVVIDKQTAFHHPFDNFLIHLLYADKLMAGCNFGKSFITKLFLDKKFSYFAYHRVVHGKRNPAHCRTDEIIPVFGNLSNVLLRSEGFLIMFFRRIDQRIQDIFFALEMLVKRRCLDPDLFCNLFFTFLLVCFLSDV